MYNATRLLSPLHNLCSRWWLSVWFGSEQRMQRCSKIEQPR